MPKFSKKSRWSASTLAIAAVLSFSAPAAQAEQCAVVTPATDVLLAKMAGAITKRNWLDLLGAGSVQANEFAQGFINLKGSDPWFETVETVISGSAFQVTAAGQAFQNLGGCSSVALILPTALAEAVANDPKLSEAIAKALPNAVVTKAESTGKAPRSGPAIELKGVESLQSLFRAIVGGGELPLGVTTKDVVFKKG